MFTRFVFPVLVFSAVFAIGYWCVLTIRKFQLNRRLTIHLQYLEQRYLEFIHDRVRLSDLNNESDSVLATAILEESGPVLKPEMDTLLDQLDQANQSLLPASLDSEIFPNVLAAYRSLWPEKAGASVVSSQQKQAFQNSLQEAIRADIHRRILHLHTNSQL